MATYVNNIRLKEITTGDEDGSWGTSTNTNLELIGEALGYNTQECFSSDTSTSTTIADGATDPARAMYLKVTSAGSLTATRDLQILPNTMSRVMFIENATTGSQSITVSQGSGATVTVIAGDTQIIYLDGAGAGAGVYLGLPANRNIDHSLVSVQAGTALSGGGTIEEDRTINLSHLGIETLADPAADRIMFWDDSETATGWLTVSTGLDLTTTSLTLSHLGLEDLTDPGADRLFFWDDSESASKFLTVGAGLNLTATTLTAGLQVSATVNTSGFTAVAGNTYKCDMTSAFTSTLPITPTEGDEVGYMIVNGSKPATYNLTIGRNGSEIENTAADLCWNINNLLTFKLTYSTENGWMVSPGL